MFDSSKVGGSIRPTIDAFDRIVDDAKTIITTLNPHTRDHRIHRIVMHLRDLVRVAGDAAGGH